jgi:DNA-binding NarL/FixJ family response regulator
MSEGAHIIGVVIADDSPFILAAVEGLFEEEHDFQILARCLNGDEALDALRTHHPEMLVLDIRMPKKDGFAVLREMRGEGISTKVVLLAGEINEKEVIDAVRLGVRGIVLKEMTPKLLLQCVRTVLAGGLWLEQRAVSLALENMVHREDSAREIGALLTPREIEIVRMVAEGRRNREIAQMLFVGEGTVKTHLHHIYEKLQVAGRLELAIYAHRARLV